jgi:uncharacterized membrane protein YfcA
MNELALATQGVSLGVVALVFLLAGFVKGVVGLGLPTVAIAVLAQLMPPAAAAGLLIVPSLLTNVWQARPFAKLGVLLRRLGPMQVAVFAGTLATAWSLGAPAGNWARIGLGVALFAYAGWGLAGARCAIGPDTERWLGPVVGLLTGVVTAATGVFVVPAVPYLQSLGLQRAELVQAMGVSFTVSTVALGIGLGWNGEFPREVVAASSLMLLPAIAGMWLGQRLGEGMSPALFRKVLLWSLVVLGGQMVLRGL